MPHSVASLPLCRPASHAACRAQEYEEPSGALEKAIEADFGALEGLVSKFNAAAGAVQGRWGGQPWAQRAAGGLLTLQIVTKCCNCCRALLSSLVRTCSWAGGDSACWCIACLPNQAALRCPHLSVLAPRLVALLCPAHCLAPTLQRLGLAGLQPRVQEAGHRHDPQPGPAAAHNRAGALAGVRRAP